MAPIRQRAIARRWALLVLGGLVVVLVTSLVVTALTSLV